jgi:transglutaminase-like putative cysteine protease
VAFASFDQTASELSFDSTLSLEQYPTTMPDVEIEEYAKTYPFSYAANEVPDLARSIERHDVDPEHLVDRWAKAMIPEGQVETLALLRAMNASIRRDFEYIPREAEGVQPPAETLAKRSGTCRDFALLLMEGARTLGIAARFVSGYLGISGSNASHVDGNTTHAWAQLYLPGAGWLDFDPTNDIVGGRDLVRVAWARDPAQAVPISGSWTGAPADYLGMGVDVAVTVEPATGGAQAGQPPAAAVPPAAPSAQAPAPASANATSESVAPSAA